jgi:hypothetical protein
MEPYWSQDYTVDLEDVPIHNVKLYHYTKKCTVLVSTPEFGRGYSDHFKEIGGKFNKYLKDIGPMGWIFKIEQDTQDKLTNILYKIYEGTVKPKIFKPMIPEIGEEQRAKRTYNMLDQLLKSLPEDSSSFVLSENEEFKTTIYYNRDDFTVTEGEYIMGFESAHKKVDIYQMKL